MTEEEAQKIVENEDFVNLIAAAQDDSNLRFQLLAMLRSDDLTRQATIQEWVQDCNTKGAPKPFVQALAYFAHREISYAAIKLLS